MGLIIIIIEGLSLLQSIPHGLDNDNNNKRHQTIVIWLGFVCLGL